jgi:hypothetical protein
VWKVARVNHPFRGAFGVTLVVKIVTGAVSGSTPYSCAASRSRRGVGIWRAVSEPAALGARLVGILLDS